MAGVLSALRNFSTGFVLTLPVLVAVSDNLVGISTVHGDSMQPSLQHGDLILVAKYFPHPSCNIRASIPLMTQVSCCLSAQV
jgi:signal peptidase I